MERMSRTGILSDSTVNHSPGPVGDHRTRQRQRKACSTSAFILSEILWYDVKFLKADWSASFAYADYLKRWPPPPGSLV